MGTHIYDEPGPRDTKTRTSIGITSMPPATTVELHDGNDHLQFIYTDLDTLDETARIFTEARANHIAALLDGKSEMIDPGLLEPDDLAVIDGELVCVQRVVMADEAHPLGGTMPVAHIRYGKKYDGSYDLAGDRTITVSRRTLVKRLSPGAVLAAVR